MFPEHATFLEAQALIYAYLGVYKSEPSEKFPSLDFGHPVRIHFLSMDLFFFRTCGGSKLAQMCNCPIGI